MLIKSYKERQQRISHKKSLILKYLRDEIWSNAHNLSQVLAVSNTAVYKTLKKLEQQELIKSYYVSELRLKIWGITPMGLLYSWGDNEAMEERPYFETSKVKPVMIQHHLDLQTARFKAEDAGWINWVPGNLLPKGIAKRPDATVEALPQNNTISIELERTIKTKKRYEVIFSLYLQAIKRGDYHDVHYVCPDPGFAIRLKRMFMLVKSVPVAGERVQLTEKHRSKFKVYALDQWPPVTLELEIE